MVRMASGSGGKNEQRIMKGKMIKCLIFGALLLAGSAIVVSCGKDDSTPAVASEFTGNQTVYALQAASDYPISGTVTFRERKDASTTIDIALTGVTDNDQHPVHLHLGDLTTANANIAALLMPVTGKDGKSSTKVSQLSDESTVTYADLIALAACVKIHLGSTGAEADVILAAGNIGSSAAKSTPGGRLGIAVCKSK